VPTEMGISCSMGLAGGKKRNIRINSSLRGREPPTLAQSRGGCLQLKRRTPKLATVVKSEIGRKDGKKVTRPWMAVGSDTMTRIVGPGLTIGVDKTNPRERGRGKGLYLSRPKKEEGAKSREVLD